MVRLLSWRLWVIWVTTANMTDQSGALTLLENNKENLSKVSYILVDGGYAGKPFADGVKERMGATVGSRQT